MKKKSLLQSLEEFGESMPVNSTEPMVQPETEDPNSTGEVVPVIAAEDNGSMPENDTSGLIAKDPEDPQAAGEVKEIGSDMVEEGKATESGIQELEVLAQEAEQVLVDLGNVNSAINELDQYRTTVAQAAANNDLTGVGAEILSTALESLYDRHGIKTTSRAIPSMESFSTPVSRARSSTIALEEVDGKLAKLKQWVVEFFKNLVAKVKEFVQKLTSRKEMLDKKSAAVIQAVNGNKTLIEPKKFINDELFDTFAVDLKWPNDPVAETSKSFRIISDYIGAVVKPALHWLNLHGIDTATKFTPEKGLAFTKSYTGTLVTNYKKFSNSKIMGGRIYEGEDVEGQANEIEGLRHVRTWLGYSNSPDGGTIVLLTNAQLGEASKLLEVLQREQNEYLQLTTQIQKQMAEATQKFERLPITPESREFIQGLTSQYSYLVRNSFEANAFASNVRLNLMKLVEMTLNSDSSDQQPQQQQ